MANPPIPPFIKRGVREERVEVKKKGGKKKRGRKKRSSFTGKCLILTIIFFSIILFYVWGRVERLEAGYKIRERVKSRDRLIKEKDILLSQAVRLKSPQRLERIAGEELGLIVPTDGKSIRRIVINQ